MTKKQTAAMQVLRTIGKQGGSASHIAELSKVHVNDVRKLFLILEKRNFLTVENDTAHLTSKFLKDVPLWKDMKSAVMTIPELE